MVGRSRMKDDDIEGDARPAIEDHSYDRLTKYSSHIWSNSTFSMPPRACPPDELPKMTASDRELALRRSFLRVGLKFIARTKVHLKF